MIRRREFLQALAAIGFGGTAFTGYAMAEAARNRVTRYAVNPPNWTPGLQLRVAVLADLHACDPWMTVERIDSIVAQTNRLGADAVVLLGDYVAGYKLGRLSREVPADRWAGSLANLKAPLGVHAVLGNHDWWDDIDVQQSRAGRPRPQLALEAAGIPVYQNDVVRLQKDGKAFWLAGLGDQWAFWPRPEESDALWLNGQRHYVGVDDLSGTLAKVTDDAPVVLLVHEPDIFPDVPSRVAVTLAGHTHGGQVRIFGYPLTVPSKFGTRYDYGHKIEDGRSMIVSGGLGCSMLPFRIAMPPEIVLVDIGSEAVAS